MHRTGSAVLALWLSLFQRELFNSHSSGSSKKFARTRLQFLRFPPRSSRRSVCALFAVLVIVLTVFAHSVAQLFSTFDEDF
eukprot:1223832-Pleurochrysis_carterae.AAC.2